MDAEYLLTNDELQAALDAVAARLEKLTAGDAAYYPFRDHYDALAALQTKRAMLVSLPTPPEDGPR